jgi:DNA-binding CsgD family transcriptional regulator
MEEVEKYFIEYGITFYSNFLSKNERVTLKLLMEGKSAKEIADILNVSQISIQSYKKHMFKIFDVKTSLELVKIFWLQFSKDYERYINDCRVASVNRM